MGTLEKKITYFC